MSSNKYISTKPIVRTIIIAQSAFIVLGMLVPLTAHAEIYSDTKYPVKVTASPKSAPADSTSQITFDLLVYGYYCADTGKVQEKNACPDGSTSTKEVGVADHNIGVYTSATSGNIYSGLKTPAGVQYVTADAQGKAQFKLASSVAEKKTFQFTDNVWGAPYQGATSTEVEFTALPVPKPVNNTTPASVDAPEVTSITVDSKVIDSTDKIELTTKQALTVQGKTIANGVITLIVLRDSKEVETPAKVIADSKGNWKYTVMNLEAGSYSLDGQTSTPESSITSPKVTLVSFKVLGAKANQSTSKNASQQSPQESSSMKFVLGAIVTALAITGVTWFVLRRRKRSPTLLPVETESSDSSPVDRSKKL